MAPKIIAISSFKGGTAKTSISLHLGAALAQFHHKKVLLIDFDAQANLTTGLGYDPDEHESLAQVLQRKMNLKQVTLTSPVPNLDIVPADTWLERIEVTGELASDRYSHERLRSIVQHLEYDIIIIDTPPSLCWLTESALIAADFSLICSTPEFYSIKGLERLSQFIQNISKRHPIEILGVAISFWNPRGKSNGPFLEVIESIFPNKLLKSKIRRDISISEAAIYGKPIFSISPNSRASEDYKKMTHEILARM